MYTLPWMKFSKRWRRIGWRLNTPHSSYAVWVSSTVLTLAFMKAFVISSGPTDTHRRRVAADGSYKRRRFAETDDNPIYRLPENPQGGHRLDGDSPWSAKAHHFAHH